MTLRLRRTTLCALLGALTIATGCDRLIEQIRERTEETPKRTQSEKKEEAQKKDDDSPDIDIKPAVGRPAEPSASPAEPSASPPEPSKLADARVNYFEDKHAIAASINKKFGTAARVLQLNIYPTHVHFQVQDKENPKHVDQFNLAAGYIERRGPVRLHMVTMGQKTIEEGLAATTFSISDVDMALLPQMVKDAPNRLKSIEDGNVTHVMLKRNVPFSDAVQWRVYINAERGSGSVVYNTKGSVTRVFD